MSPLFSFSFCNDDDTMILYAVCFIFFSGDVICQLKRGVGVSIPNGFSFNSQVSFVVSILCSLHESKSCSINMSDTDRSKVFMVGCVFGTGVLSFVLFVQIYFFYRDIPISIFGFAR